MPAIQISEGIWWIGVNVRSHDLFEGLWPLPHGVSLNSYLVRGEQTAVIDLVREWSGSSDTFLQQLESAGCKAGDIDYVVLNHLEPDHTGFLTNLRRMAPRATILSTPKGVDMVRSFYGITDGVRAVADGEELDLGGGKVLRFVHTPFVHWPETMMTHVPSDRVLFSCDGFGGFGTLKGILFDDEVLPEDEPLYYDEMLRYYANIVANFSVPVLRALDKLRDVSCSMVAPSHGLVWRKNPERVVDWYRRFAEYHAGKGEQVITLLWSSMYGNTRAATDAVMRGIAAERVPVEVFEVPGTHDSYILASMFKNRGVVVGAPTYEGKLFPPMAHSLDEATRKRLTAKKAWYFGSYGWSGGARRDFNEVVAALKWDASEPLEFKGAPTPADLGRLEEAGAAFARRIKEQS